jgi:hypothetical protein
MCISAVVISAVVSKYEIE